MLANLTEDGKESGAGGVGADPNGGAEPGEDPKFDPQKEIMDAVNLYKSMNGGKKE